MNKKLKVTLTASLLLSSAFFIQPAVSSDNNIFAGQKVKAATARQIESLNRGLTAVKTSNGVLVSWRLLGTEDYNTGFNLYKDGKKIAGPITDSTNYLDKSGSISSKYYVKTVINGVEQTQSAAVKTLADNYMDVPIQKPADTYLNGGKVTYSANDATVADVDGDGEYEIILKWEPSNDKDNSQAGYTSNVYIDAYKLSGMRLWRIDLGKNIRAGAHYTQFIAYDFNGDGKAEIAMKTADGTVAGDGTVIGDRNKDYRNSGGYVLSGPEYLTLFEGNTGKILNTQDFTPLRGNVNSWGDKYGNRVDRFLAGVAYLDGRTPSLIMCRGYYTRAVLSAYQYRNGKLNKQWTFDSNNSGNSAYAGQGAHSLNIADVDNDGFDEIVYGAAVIDHNGRGLYSTRYGHGDALHTGDFDPHHPGLETFMVHEDKNSNAGIELREASNGKTLFSRKTGSDVGRGVIANIGPDYSPYVILTTRGCYDSKGNEIKTKASSLGKNFTTYWDGDLYQEIMDDTHIEKWNPQTKNIDRLLTGQNVHSCNGTKATPSLSSDILGDFREEVIWPTSDNSALRIYMTPYETKHKLYTLMSDTQYRTAIAWQNVAYNQPPHPSYYIGEDMKVPSKPIVYAVGNYSENNGNTITPDTPVTSPHTDTIPGTTINLTDGWYYIKNVNAQKYLQVTDNIGKSGQNVEISTGNGTDGQKFYLQNLGNGYVTLKSALGDYMIDVAGAEDKDGANIGIYNAYSGDAQQFMLKTSATNGAYIIATKCSNLTKVLDGYESGKKDGTNICQWKYGGKSNQQWVFEKTNTSSNTNTDKPSTPSTPAKLKLDYTINNWGDSYQVNFKITNNSSSDINTWTLKLKKNDINIGTSWNINVKENDDYYIITPVNWNSRIPKGSSIEFGIQGSGSINNSITYSLA